MGLGKLLTRNLTYDVTNTVTGATGSYEVIIDKGIYPDWGGRHYRGGMGVPAAWRCALLLSDLLGRLPWDAYRRRGGQPVEKLDPAPPLLTDPAGTLLFTRMDVFSSWALDLVWDGNAVGIIADRDSTGRPTAVLPVPARLVQARRVHPADLPIGPFEYIIGGRVFDPRDVLHIRGPHEPGGLRGMGVLENHLLGALHTAQAQDEHAGSVSEYAVPSGLLKATNPDTTVDELKDMKERWLKNQRQRTVQAVNATTEFQPLSWNPAELDLVTAQKFTLHQIALIFGMPLSFLGVEQSSRTYSNTVEESMQLLKFGAPAGMLARFEQALTGQMPHGTYVRANLDSLLRPDVKTRYEAYALALDPVKGFMDRSEVRELEDLPPEDTVVDGELVDDQPALQRASKLAVGQGHPLWEYWVHGEGLARWVGHPHPWTSLRDALLSEGVPVHEADGLASNIFHGVFGIWPSERPGVNHGG